LGGRHNAVFSPAILTNFIAHRELRLPPGTRHGDDRILFDALLACVYSVRVSDVLSRNPIKLVVGNVIVDCIKFSKRRSKVWLI